MMCSYKKFKHVKKPVLLGIIMLLITVLCIPAAAAGTSSLTLVFSQDGMVFNLYRTADLEPDGSYTFSGQFKDCPVELPGYDWLETAVEVAAYAEDKQPDAQKTISGGSLTFSDLQEGLYLVTGTSLVSQGIRYTPVPFLVRIENGNVTSYVKSDQEIVEEPTVTYQVKKVWKDDDAESRPNSVTVKLLKDGSLFQVVTLSAENGWSYSWKDTGEHTWQVQEIQVPEDYTATVSHQGNIFTITNTLSSSSQPSPGPGTGENMMLWWLAGMAAISSLMVIVIIRHQKVRLVKKQNPPEK